ncbi:MAG: anaerobic ribonucleoside-triphosphate reductase activating protein [Coriobacteriales bacterium]|jgi:anaerobic ribonucleoside-triphosphate reductase activating protein|nr:anaerobic ribonucleoside-triphosphate reductase activating protein [Coriobacteriales bacterium]
MAEYYQVLPLTAPASTAQATATALLEPTQNSTSVTEITPVRLFGVADDSIVDGPGIRYAVFVQGCSHCCPGCHNPQALSRSGGRWATIDELWEQIEANPLLCGITLSGGEPFEQPEPLLELVRRAQAARLSVWAYSGYTYEQLAAGMPCVAARELLVACDVLVDGRYLVEQASYDLRWRGSANQRIIDVEASLTAGRAVELVLE